MTSAETSRLRPTLCADERVTRADKESGLDEHREHFAAEHGVVRPEACGLRQRQSQVGHLQKIRLCSPNGIVEARIDTRIADVEFGHGGLPSLTLAIARQGLVTGTSTSCNSPLSRFFTLRIYRHASCRRDVTVVARSHGPAIRDRASARRNTGAASATGAASDVLHADNPLRVLDLRLVQPAHSRRACPNRRAARNRLSHATTRRRRSRMALGTPA